MDTLANILTNSYANQGVQDLKVFFDSFFFNLKVKDNTKNYNIVLIEKTAFDFSTEIIEKKKNGLTVNFGDTGSDEPYKTNGNYYIDSFLDSRYKTVLLVGTRKMTNGNIIPLVYLYDVNLHTVKAVFPKNEDITQFNSFSNYSFDNTSRPVAKLVKNKLYIAFITKSAQHSFINKITFTVYKDKVEQTEYEVYKYDISKSIKLNEILDSSIHFTFGDYKNVFKKLKNDEFNYDPLLFTLSGYTQIFALDDGVSVLAADYAEQISKTPQGTIGN